MAPQIYRKFKSLIKENVFFGASGFTIVEALVAAGLLSGLSLAVINLTDNLSKASRKSSQDMKVNSLKMEAYSVFSNPASCEATLAGLNSGGAAVPTIQDGSGNVILTNGGVYGEATGNAKARITINSINIANYSAISDPYSSDASVAAAVNDRVDGKIDIVINFSRGDRSNGKTDAEEALRTGGNVSGTITVPVRVSTNMAGTIQSCLTTRNSFVDAFCDSFDGDSTFDSKCRHVTIQDADGSTDYAATFKGNVNIEGSDIGANAAFNHLYVYGSTGVGRSTESGALDVNDGRLSASGSLLVGPGLSPAGLLSGSAHFSNSVGIGIAPNTSLASSLTVLGSTSFGSGVNVPGANGSLTIEGSLGVGVVAPATVGTVQVARNVGVGIVPTTAAASQLSALSMSVGSGMNDPGAGNVIVEGFVHLPNAPDNDNNPTHAATQEWVARKVSNTLNPDVINEISDILNDILSSNPGDAGAGAVCKGFRVNNAKTPGTTYSAQATYSSGTGCRLAPMYCNVNGQCSSVFAEGGGINSSGSIVASPGDIKTTTGHVYTSTGTGEGNTVKGNKICLPDPSFNASSATVCKTSWNSITIEHGGCYTRSAGSNCNSGDFLTKITVTKKNISPATDASASPNYYAGKITSATVSSSQTTYSIMSNISYTCCEAVNK